MLDSFWIVGYSETTGNCNLVVVRLRGELISN